MKTLIFVLTFFAAVSATASASITVKSFQYIDGKKPHAELCGFVNAVTTTPTLIRMVVDPRGKPGVYNTVAGTDGNFCLTLISYTGEAELSVFGGAPAPASITK